jgi:hypothetical protein
MHIGTIKEMIELALVAYLALGAVVFCLLMSILLMAKNSAQDLEACGGGSEIKPISRRRKSRRSSERRNAKQLKDVDRQLVRCSS